MRGAGCTWNDLADREIDAEVARTRSRPLPSGQVTPMGALGWGIAQSLAAFLILLSFGFPAIWWGVASLALVAIYPFAKRFTWWPQVFLGLAFNWGALLLWVASTGGIAPAPVLLYAAGILWTLHYDTIYAHQDREDDALIGVKSTARLFEEGTERMLWLFIGGAASCATLAVLAAGGGWPGLLGGRGLCGAPLLAGEPARHRRPGALPARCSGRTGRRGCCCWPGSWRTAWSDERRGGTFRKVGCTHPPPGRVRVGATDL